MKVYEYKKYTVSCNEKNRRSIKQAKRLEEALNLGFFAATVKDTKLRGEFEKRLNLINEKIYAISKVVNTENISKEMHGEEVKRYNFKFSYEFKVFLVVSHLTGRILKNGFSFENLLLLLEKSFEYNKYDIVSKEFITSPVFIKNVEYKKGNSKSRKYAKKRFYKLEDLMKSHIVNSQKVSVQAKVLLLEEKLTQNVVDDAKKVLSLVSCNLSLKELVDVTSDETFYIWVICNHYTNRLLRGFDNMTYQQVKGYIDIVNEYKGFIKTYEYEIVRQLV